MNEDRGRAAADGTASEGYLPIAEHGLIGDLRTAALVGTDGRINWFCAPRFDSPSIFGALLDARDGGHWHLSPVGDVATRQQYYFPDTNILMTRMLTENGIVEIQDFMPIRAEETGTIGSGWCGGWSAYGAARVSGRSSHRG